MREKRKERRVGWRRAALTLKRVALPCRPPPKQLKARLG